MAGKYSRFRLFGSQIPKYLLPLGSETVLAIILRNYVKWVDPKKVFLIANRNDQIFFPIVRSTLKKFSIPWDNLIYIDDTSSQLETATASSELLSTSAKKKPVAFANIDTVLKNRKTFFDALSACSEEMGAVDTFNGTSIQYSYANIDENSLVTDIIDQKIISEYACSGLYGFGSYQYMHKIANDILKRSGSSNFTQLYQEYIQNNHKVIATHVESPLNTIVLGTPEEYVINIHKFA